MSARIRWLLAVVASVAMLDATVAWLDRRASQAREASVGGNLREFDLAGVAKLSVSRSGRPPVVLARSKGGAWVVATSKNFPARGERVEQTLARIRAWKRERIAGDASNHEKFAVTREKGISVRVEDYAGQVLSDIIIGSVTGVDSEEARKKGGSVDTSKMGRYMRVADEDPVFVVNDFVLGELEPEAQEWLARPITGGDEKAAARLVVTHRTGEQVAVAFDPPYARFATADQRPVDVDHAKGLLREVLNAWATNVTDGDDAKLGLANPLVTAEVAFADGTPPVKMLVGDLAPATSGAAPCYAVRVPGKPGPLLVPQFAIAQIVSASAESISMKHVFGDRQEHMIARASFREGERTIAIEQDPNRGGWNVSVVGSGSRALDEAKRLRVTRAVVSLTVAGFDRMGTSTHGLSSPMAVLDIETQNKERFQLQIGATEAGYVWVRRADLPVAIAAPPEVIAELRAAFAAAAD